MTAEYRQEEAAGADVLKSNPLLVPSDCPYGAPPFDRIEKEHYLPAFREAVMEAKAQVDAIADDPAEPTFENVVERLEYSARSLDRVSGIFFNLLEADADDRMQEMAEEISPMLTEYSLYVSMNQRLFEKVKKIRESADALALEQDARKLLDDTFRSFVRNGADLPKESREEFARCSEELSLLSLQFGKNVLAATNAFHLHITDAADLEGLPQYVRDAGAEAAKEKGLTGWVYTLDHPSYGPFMKYSSRRDLRKRMYMAYGTRAVSGENDNRDIVRKIAALRVRLASMLGYASYADYALEERMARTPAAVNGFLSGLMDRTLPFAKNEIARVSAYAKENGFEEDELQPWDFSYWAERFQKAEYEFDEEALKPYFRLENCIDAVFALANRLYGLTFTERTDIPVYHKDVKVYDVLDENGRHMALFYADFFPRPTKRSGAWMTEFRGQGVWNGVEERPFISIVTNFTKPAADSPSLLTHSEFTTLLHEFGHALHGILSEGRYPSLTGTNVARDFVELPSQIMENWAFEPEYLDTFARDWRTGAPVPKALVEKIVAAQNYLAGYQQVRQLQFGLLDMAWHTPSSIAGDLDVLRFERDALEGTAVLPTAEQTCISVSFSHIFSGGYAAGYYSYKWAEVLEADAFSLFREKGIFSRVAADSFRRNILSRGGSEDPDVLYRRFRGRDPEPDALMRKLGLVTQEQ